MIKNNKIIILSLFFSLFITLIIYFPIKFPFQDDWNNIYILSLDLNFFDLLFVKENDHIQIISRIILFLNYIFLNLNFYYIQFLSIILILFSCLIFLKKNITTNHFITVFFFISIFFSGRLFPTITASYNIVWLISLFLIIYLSQNIKNSNLEKIYYRNFVALFFLLVTISISLSYLIFFILVFLLSKNKIRRNSIYYIFFFLIFFILINLYSDIYLKNYNELTHTKSNILNLFESFKFSNFFISFFGVTANLFVPIIKSTSILAVIIGVMQSIFLIVTFKKNYGSISRENILKFILENQLIVIGYIFAFLISIFRAGEFIEARFTTGSIIYQLGFWLYFFKFYSKKKYYNAIIISFLIANILVGFFSPYLGIYWQINQHIKSQNVINCIKNETKLDCHKVAYFEAFNGGNWFNYEKFIKSLDFIEKNNLNIFYAKENINN